MLLEINTLNAGYSFLQILREVELQVDKGEFVCLIGPNGAGKSTVLKSIAGILSQVSGTIAFQGENITNLPAYKVFRKGIAFVSESMNLFTQMSVEENLALGAYRERNNKIIQERLEYVYELFPRLKERTGQLAGTLSGGERKMVAIARALMGSPQLLLVDEPSFGLAPQMTESVFGALEFLNTKEQLSILVVEQNVGMTLQYSQRGYVLEHGSITVAGSSEELAENTHVRKAYLGV